jgi:hypothetical protein
MMFALGAAGSLIDALASLTASKSSSATTSTGQSQGTANPFDLGGGAQTQGTTGFSGCAGGPSISPQTMSALIEAQSQSGTANTTPTDPSSALNDLFSQIDGDGNGSISKQEFENALGAGGTNLAQADDVFNKLDSNGDGSVSLDELKSALQGSGHHGHHHHMHASSGSGGSNDGTSGDSSSDPLMQMLNGATSNSVTNSDGSTTTSITYADGSTVSLTTPAASSSSSSSSATSSYNLIERMIQKEAQSLSASLSSSFAVSA